MDLCHGQETRILKTSRKWDKFNFCDKLQTKTGPSQLRKGPFKIIDNKADLDFVVLVFIID